MRPQANFTRQLAIIAVFAASCVMILVYLWGAFGGNIPLKPKNYQLNADFPDASNLALNADVRISGVNVGHVIAKSSAAKNTTRVTFDLKPEYAPLPVDAHAMLRQKTAFGEIYVDVTPGDRRKPKLPEGGSIAKALISPSVELDEIFRAFDPKTRAEFQNWIQTFAQTTDGRARDINDALGNLPPFAADTTTLLQILESQSGAVRKLVSNTGVVFNALSERDGQLQGLIKNSNTVFSTTAKRNQELAQTFQALPTFEKESERTVKRLTTFAKNTDPLISQLRPAARQLSPTLQELSATAPDLKALFRDLDPAITASKKGLPATQALLDELKPFLGQLDPTLTQLNPILDFLGRYKTELGPFFANSTAATQAASTPPGGGPSDPKVHYLRTSNPLNLENLAAYPKRLATNRNNPYPPSGSFNNLANGLQVFDDRSCNAGALPTLAGGLGPISTFLGPSLTEQLQKVLGTTDTSAAAEIAPPCKKQGPFTVNGRTTQFPQVTASAAGATGG
jgi:virulence factor Mce-like protein